MLSGIIPACFHNVGLGADEQAVQPVVSRGSV